MKWTRRLQTIFEAKKLQPFLIRNPEAEVEARDERPVVVRPWWDDSIELRLEGDEDELLNALNAVRMFHQSLLLCGTKQTVN